ncbi:hypothetical protein CCMA1212_008703 [Trichoderma ghanense]|uniref:Uncharacterized protein n=1 Tax=Trichoderma ghanense TaxID=65468 RepID=A0ABY2GU58_9HYPO
MMEARVMLLLSVLATIRLDISHAAVFKGSIALIFIVLSKAQCRALQRFGGAFAAIQDTGHQGSHHASAPAGLKNKTPSPLSLSRSLTTLVSLHSPSSASLKIDSRQELPVIRFQHLCNISNPLKFSDFSAALSNLPATCLPQSWAIRLVFHQSPHLEKLCIDCLSPLFSAVGVRFSPQVEHLRPCLAAEVRLAELSKSARHFGRLDILRASTEDLSTTVSIFQSLPRISSNLLLSKDEFHHHSGDIAFPIHSDASALVGLEH